MIQVRQPDKVSISHIDANFDELYQSVKSHTNDRKVWTAFLREMLPLRILCLRAIVQETFQNEVSGEEVRGAMESIERAVDKALREMR